MFSLTRQAAAVLLLLAVFFCPFASIALEALFSSHPACSKVLARQSRDLEIIAWIQQFPILTSRELEKSFGGHTREAFIRFFTALDRVDLNQPTGELSIEYQHPQWNQSVRFKLDPQLVAGWLRLGVLKKNQNSGSVDLSLTPALLAHHFEMLTGLTPILETHILAGGDFSNLIVRDRRFPLDDIHAYLFHAPYLAIDERKSFLMMQLEFMDLELHGLSISIWRTIPDLSLAITKVDVSSRILEANFEAIDHALDSVLRGPLQILTPQFLSPRTPKSAPPWTEVLQYLDDSEKRGAIHHIFARYYPIYDEDEKNEWIALELMRISVQGAIAKREAKKLTDETLSRGESFLLRIQAREAELRPLHFPTSK